MNNIKKSCNDSNCDNPECVCTDECSDDTCFTSEIRIKSNHFQINIPYFIFENNDDMIDDQAKRTFKYLKESYKQLKDKDLAKKNHLMN